MVSFTEACQRQVYLIMCLECSACFFQEWEHIIKDKELLFIYTRQWWHHSIVHKQAWPMQSQYNVQIWISTENKIIRYIHLICSCKPITFNNLSVKTEDWAKIVQVSLVQQWPLEEEVQGNRISHLSNKPIYHYVDTVPCHLPSGLHMQEEQGSKEQVASNSPREFISSGDTNETLLSQTMLPVPDLVELWRDKDVLDYLDSCPIQDFAR